MKRKYQWIGKACGLLSCAVTVLALASRATLASPRNHEASAHVTVHPEEPGAAIAPDFLGFSYEAPVLAQRIFVPSNDALARLLANLGGGTLRFGGNSVEFTAWSEGGRAPKPGERAVVDGKDLDDLFAFSRKTRWPVILGVNLGHYNPALYSQEAAYAVRRGGRQLLALEIGNESNLFMHNGLRPSTWDYADFLREWEAYFQAIRARAPAAPVSGPTTCCKNGLEWFPLFLRDESPHLMLATHHIYPMSAAATNPNSPSYPAIERMLAPGLMARVAGTVRGLASASQARHLPLRIAETNSASHGGKDGVSNVFASALWGADYAFTLAEQGAEGLNFHGGFVCRGYTAVCIANGHYVAQPLYYGMLLFASAAPGRIVPAAVKTATNVTVHAVLAKDGTLRLVLINKDPRRPLHVQIGGAANYTRASALRLTAPSLAAKSGISFGGSVVGADGAWRPRAGKTLARSGAVYRAELPAASATLITFEK